ncbi:hypothetical protein NA57DRAFT_27179, partial [Rhizodiscina lignyota]
GTTFVTVLVGRSQEKFLVHEGLIRARSAFFEKALSRDWKEAQKKLVELPETDVPQFTLYERWLYTSTIYSRSEDGLGVSEGRLLIESYFLGDMLQDADFKDAVIDAIINVLIKDKIYATFWGKDIYENTPPESPLRKLTVDCHLDQRDTDWFT